MRLKKNEKKKDMTLSRVLKFVDTKEAENIWELIIATCWSVFRSKYSENHGCDFLRINIQNYLKLTN